MSAPKKIDYRFKILYAVAMVMVVASHTRGGGVTLFWHWFPYSSIQLAIFAFASGYFYRRRAQKHPGQFIYRKFKHLIIPMYLYNFAYAWLVYVLHLRGFQLGSYVTWQSLLLWPLTDGGQFVFNVGTWFMVPLFLIHTFAVWTRQFFDPLTPRRRRLPEWAYFTFCLCLGILGNTLAIKGFDSGWWLLLVRFLHLLPFYAGGILYRRVLERHDTLPTAWYLGLLILAKLAIAAYLGRMPDYTPIWLDDLLDGPILPIVVGFLGVAFWLRVARLLEPVLGRSRAVNAIADSIYSIAANQFLGFMLVKATCGLIATITPYFSDFDFAAYHTDIWYYYQPFGQEQFLIIYLVAGIVLPIYLQRGFNFIRRELRALDERSPQPPPGQLRHHQTKLHW